MANIAIQNEANRDTSSLVLLQKSADVGLLIPIPSENQSIEIRSWDKTLAIVPIWDYYRLVRVIALSTLKAFWENNKAYRDAREPVLAWYRHALNADWSTPAEVKRDFRNASILRDGRVVFNIAGNKYRLVVWINYAYRVVYVRFIGTHAEYDAIDAQTI